ncbi:hypothetical protein ABZW32_39100 [Streptomyces sp. NPDC004667]|uniref:hypothetical protein n=1 Tax=Streptomyces sp. NPDC004667 TaxID=3154285 RepID=UPI0033BF579F
MRWTGIPALVAALVLGWASLHTAAALADADIAPARSQKWTTVPVALGAAPGTPPATEAASPGHPAPSDGQADENAAHGPPGTFDIAAAVALTGGALCVTYAFRRKGGGRRPSGSRRG